MPLTGSIVIAIIPVAIIAIVITIVVVITVIVVVITVITVVIIVVALITVIAIIIVSRIFPVIVIIATKAPDARLSVIGIAVIAQDFSIARVKHDLAGEIIPLGNDADTAQKRPVCFFNFEALALQLVNHLLGDALGQARPRQNKDQTTTKKY